MTGDRAILEQIGNRLNGVEGHLTYYGDVQLAEEPHEGHYGEIG